MPHKRTFTVNYFGQKIQFIILKSFSIQMSNYIHVVFNFYTTTSQVTQLSNWSSSQQNSSKLDVHTTHNCLFQKNSLNHISTMALCRAQTRINTPVVIRINPKLWCDYYQTRTIYITREHALWGNIAGKHSSVYNRVVVIFAGVKIHEFENLLFTRF